MQLISYAGRPAALTDQNDTHFLPPFDRMELDHPRFRFLAGKCLWAQQLEAGIALGIFDHRYYEDAAELYARAILIPDAELRARWHWSDPELAEHFNVPLEQIEPKRADMWAASGDAAYTH